MLQCARTQLHVVSLLCNACDVSSSSRSHRRGCLGCPVTTIATQTPYNIEVESCLAPDVDNRPCHGSTDYLILSFGLGENHVHSPYPTIVKFYLNPLTGDLKFGIN